MSLHRYDSEAYGCKIILWTSVFNNETKVQLGAISQD